MATTRYDAVAAREYERNGEKKTSFTNIGVAFPMKDRDGYSIRLHAMPAPVDGEYTILLFPPKPKEETRDKMMDNYDAGRQRDRDERRELDDEIPF